MLVVGKKAIGQGVREFDFDLCSDHESVYRRSALMRVRWRVPASDDAAILVMTVPWCHPH